jgi:phosphoribosylformimino-5-aminoimidazole carboxamide ribotide isomerase
MSIIIPALDIIDGNCVRLSEGSFETSKLYDRDPVSVAKRFEDAGATKLHLVDLDGAKNGEVVHLDLLEQIVSATSLSVDFSGGLRSKENISSALSAGASQVVIGSSAIKNPEAFCEWVTEFGSEKIILSADVREERIAVSGWLEQTEISVFSFIQEFLESVGIEQVIVTDISKDGILLGPNFSLYQKLVEAFPMLRIVASGGVSSLTDIETLREIPVSGAIVGKAFYEGLIPLTALRSF